jgi:V/A-type H+/Na+-transporting ATPase subunit E
MGLQEVVHEVRDGAERRAQEILQAARAEADGILDDARKQVAAYEAERSALAKRDVEQVRRQGESHAGFESRKRVLETESRLRIELRGHIISGLAALDEKTRGKHIEKLLKQATGLISSGSVRGAKSDEAVLKSAKPYNYAGTIDIAGGIVVESKDGSERLDLSYETLLDGVWRDVLAAEAGLFSA